MRAVYFAGVLLFGITCPVFAVDTDNDGIPDPSDSSPSNTSLPGYTPLYTKTGYGAVGDVFGWSVSGLGDINNDGYSDFIVGDFLDDASKYNGGTARVFSGKTGSLIYTFNPVATLDYMGHAVAGAGDVNNDGRPDIIVGAYGASSLAGFARVFNGANGSILYTFYGNSASQRLGYYVSGAGDVNNDNYDDVIVGSIGSVANVYSGKTGAVLYTYNFSGKVGKAGDVNQDGYADFLVGYRVFSGSNGALLYNLQNSLGGGNFVSLGDVAGVGDINGDGYPDMAIGDTGVAGGGCVYVFSGANGKKLAQYFKGISTGSGFGFTLDAAGDVNKDGFADLIVGGSGFDAARVISGANGASLYTFVGASTSDKFGYSVASAGDTNNDTYPDFIVGAYEAGASSQGQAMVFSGALNAVYWATDSDGDSVNDFQDALPLEPLETLDMDRDGIGNNGDGDDDGDGVPDVVDAAPLDAGNTNETGLPLNAPFKGSSVNEAVIVQ
ncbi:MAG TPA: FG-GAP-like repeat-containing protein [Pseudomonadales bacterium]|nr:FG-GAP-like repeat-containing protein [Pseudomonadales bacterium]